MPSQVEEEVRNMLEFLKYVYELFGFTFELVLATRPEKFIGDVELWNRAEDMLKLALESFTVVVLFVWWKVYSITCREKVAMKRMAGL